ncbi:MAG: hypothetical protein RBT69_10030, partial [Spirochaetia bacterium]|nr:hypothetical protein [Spirochaetia bacterium]
MKKISLIALFLIIMVPALIFSDSVSENQKKGFSYFFSYPVLMAEDEEFPCIYGLGAGINIDLGGKIPVFNLTGIEFSAGYNLLDVDEYYHYFSTGLGYYIRSSFDFPVNFGFRFSAGAGWVIETETNSDTDNNYRMNGLYTAFSPFVEIKTQKHFYFVTGYEARDQKIEHSFDEGDNKDRDDRVHF